VLNKFQINPIFTFRDANNNPQWLIDGLSWMIFLTLFMLWALVPAPVPELKGKIQWRNIATAGKGQSRPYLSPTKLGKQRLNRI
jgi:hypothetical protein